MSALPRDAISRSEFFLNKAVQANVDQREEFEAYLEASIIFARAAMHRLLARYKNHPAWKNWWDNLLSDPTVMFFRKERDLILKEGPPIINQVIRMEAPDNLKASDLYYYEEPTIPATETLKGRLHHLKSLVEYAELTFNEK